MDSEEGVLPLQLFVIVGMLVTKGQCHVTYDSSCGKVCFNVVTIDNVQQKSTSTVLFDWELPSVLGEASISLIFYLPDNVIFPQNSDLGVQDFVNGFCCGTVNERSFCCGAGEECSARKFGLGYVCDPQDKAVG